MNTVCLDGEIFSADHPVLLAANRGFRYGDALFETMKIVSDKILLEKYHFERLLAGIQLMKFEKPGSFGQEKLNAEILHLCRLNSCEEQARVRLTAFRGNGGLYDESKELQYLIECWPLNDKISQWNENGLLVDIFPDARKSCDRFSNLKSANYLPYVMATLYAKENKLDDCLLLNVSDRICDATTANIFWIRDKIIYTPPLSEGCVAGVMRRYLLEKLGQTNYKIQEQVCEINDLENADEIFLTNAIKGIQWVRQFGNKNFSHSITKNIFKNYLS